VNPGKKQQRHQEQQRTPTTAGVPEPLETQEAEGMLVTAGTLATVVS